MKKISVDKLIDFRRKKSDGTKFTVLHKTQEEKVKKPDESGGHYWVCCISTARSVFKTDDKNLLTLKMDELQEWIEATDHEGTKKRWKQNITMLHHLEDYDFGSIKPSTPIHLLKKPSDKLVLKINDLMIESSPQDVYSYTNGDFEEVGAVWFVAKKDGFTKSELAMYCDIMYRFLHLAYSDKFKINPKYCVAVDLFNAQEVNYAQIISGEVISLLDSTIEDVKTALKKLNYL